MLSPGQAELPAIDDRRHHHAASIVLLVTVAFCAHFLRGSEMGLHVEDFVLVPPVMEGGPGVVVEAMASVHSFQGRPLHFLSIFGLSYLGNAAGGLRGVYAVAFFFLALNSLLVYFLLLRLQRDLSIAQIGALAFVLFPADGTRPWLTIALGVQPAVTLILVAFHLYGRGRFWWSHLVAASTLICYETIFPLFVVAPWLMEPESESPGRETQGGKRSRRILHLVSMAVLLLVAVAVRLFGSEGRVTGLKAGFLLETIPHNILVGPVVAISSFVYRPGLILSGKANDPAWSERLSLTSGPGQAWAILAACLCGLVIMTALYRRAATQDTVADGARLMVVLCSGLAMLSASYALTINPFNHDVTLIAGRDSRLHTAASLGAALVVAGVVGRLKPTKSMSFLRPMLVPWAVVLVISGVKVQEAYSDSWQMQQRFWQDVCASLGPIQKGDIVLLDVRRALEDPGQVGTNELILRKLRRIYRYPGDWEWHQEPAAFALASGWQTRIELDANGRILLDPRVVSRFTFGKSRPYDPRRVTLLSNESGRFEPVTTIEVGGRKVELKPPGPAQLPAGVEKGPLYSYLIEPKVEPVRY